MSIYPSPDKLDSQESKYGLVILAAKRTRQLKDGARKLVESRSTNPLTTALEEIAGGYIKRRERDSQDIEAYKASLKPAEPSLEDIISAGMVLPIEPEADHDIMTAQIEALRTSDEEDDLQDDDPEEKIRRVDEVVRDGSLFADDDEDRADNMGDDE